MVAQKMGPVAVIDSGLGGISVLRELVKAMPGEDFLYFGDSANAPYGTKSTQTVRELTFQVAEALFDRGCKALVVACNTATAAAIADLRARWPQGIIVGVEPALKLALDHHQGGRVAVMGTNVTIREQKFQDLMARFRGRGAVYPLACPGIVEFVERGELEGPALEQLLREELAPAMAGGPLDAVVLGCTHYPFVKQAVARVVGPQAEIVDGGEGTARETRRRLTEAGLLRTDGGAIRMENSLHDPNILELGWKLLRIP